METVKKYLRIERSKIFFLKFILEAYDGIALLRTIDPESGFIALHVSPGCEEDVEMILCDLEKDIMIEDVPDHTES